MVVCSRILAGARMAVISMAPPRNSIVARDRPVMRCHPVGKIQHDLVHIAPPPAFRGIIAFDDRMAGGVEMLGRMLVLRIVAAADMAAAPAEPQMNPCVAELQAFLAAQRAGRDLADFLQMGAVRGHGSNPVRNGGSTSPMMAQNPTRGSRRQGRNFLKRTTFLEVSNRGKESAMPGKHTSHVKDSDKYEALRRKGMSK